MTALFLKNNSNMGAGRDYPRSYFIHEAVSKCRKLRDGKSVIILVESKIQWDRRREAL
jgi:hypothetical protein